MKVEACSCRAASRGTGVTDELRWRHAQTKEAAIAAAKDRSKRELWLQQRREDALGRREGAGATTADGTGGHDEGGAAGGCWSRD